MNVGTIPGDTIKEGIQGGTIKIAGVWGGEEHMEGHSWEIWRSWPVMMSGQLDTYHVMRLAGNIVTDHFILQKYSPLIF